MLSSHLYELGYGGEIENSGTVTSYSNDGGIDGVIKEDVLGFEHIYIQAKRHDYHNKIGREDLQKFVGACNNHKKAVFITTSSFKKTALDYVDTLTNLSLILIDGQKLAEYMYEYSLGMQTEQTIEIKKLDNDYWDNLQPDSKLNEQGS